MQWKRVCGEWLFFLVIMAPLVLMIYYDRSHPTGEQKSAIEAREERSHIQARRKFWFEQIEAGEASFSEAGCIDEQHGDWDKTTFRCK